MRFIAVCFVTAGLAGSAGGQSAAQTKVPAPKAAAAQAATTKGTAAVKVAPGKAAPAHGAPAQGAAAKGTPVRRPVVTTSKGASKAGGKSRKQVVARRPVQQQPSLQRYQEIQQALADKGYFRGPVDGAWGPESTEALKRFQREQNLDGDGKIGALSLMALGLGPNRGAASAQTARAPSDAPNETPDGTADTPPVPLAQP